MQHRSDDDGDLVERFLDVVEHLNHRLNSDRVDQWQGLDMTGAQVKTLVMLETIGPMRMGAISSHLSGNLSATTGILDRLVKRELVARVADPNDRRVVVCELTPLGAEAVNQLWRIPRERILPAVELLDRQQLANAVQALEAIREADERLQGPADPAESNG